MRRNYLPVEEQVLEKRKWESFKNVQLSLEIHLHTGNVFASARSTAGV
jgi:hypothetical protein